MKKTRNVVSILALVLGAALYASPAAAATPVSCSGVVNGYLDEAAYGLTVVGTRVTARGWLGFSSFTMKDGYQVETNPLHTSAAATQDTFIAPWYSNDAFTGYFHDVFPGRGNGDEDRWRLWVGRGGKFWLLSVTWGGSWTLVQSPVCYRESQGQLIMTGHISTPGFGTDFWTFVMQRNTLG